MEVPENRRVGTKRLELWAPHSTVDPSPLHPYLSPVVISVELHLMKYISNSSGGKSQGQGATSGEARCSREDGRRADSWKRGQGREESNLACLFLRTFSSTDKSPPQLLTLSHHNSLHEGRVYMILSPFKDHCHVG